MTRREADGHARPQRPGDFGPFQALTALTDIQRLGLDAATEVARGFAGLLGTEPDAPPPPDLAGDQADPASDRSAPNGHQPDLAQLRVTVARALDLYADLTRRSFEGYADLMDQLLRARGVEFDGVEFDSAPGGLLTLQGAAGTRATGTVWMHNTTARQASAVLRLTDLASHDERVVPAAGGCFQPAVLTIEPGASVAATVEVALGHAAPGVYHGHVLARGLPDAALPVRLLVRAGPGQP
jgi:hypothetical protein